MGLIGRLIRLLVVVVVILAVALGGLVGLITVRALPQTSGTLVVAGLEGDVTVIRDANGIIQIYAGSPHDLFLAQGYVHAQERLWQMEVWRHIGAGRLSELFGKSQLETDRFIRTLDWRGAAKRDLEAASPELRAGLEAYAEGVNAYLERHRGGLSLPFVVTGLRAGLGGGLGGYEPEPWTPLDSATWQKVQAWNLGGNYRSEIFRVLADAELGDPARTDELFPPYADDAPVIVPSGAPGSGGAGAAHFGPSAAADPGDSASADPGTGAETATAATSPTLTADERAALLDLARTGARISALAGLDPTGAGEGLAGHAGIGSNNWVVGPSRSATGSTLLANDPHLPIGMPSIWIMNGLHCREVSEACPWDVAGVSFPGVPAIVLGHNARIAWGATNVDPDVQDLFIEKEDPADPSKYLHGEGSLAFTVRREEIRVAGGGTETLEVRETVHGPVMNDADERLRDSDVLYALRWTAIDEPDGTLESIFRLGLAGGWDDFRAALSLYGAPAQNFVYADVDGHIGYQMPGRVPIRANPADRGDRPVPGWDGAHEWTGTIAYDDLPRLFDPPEGIIVTANNAVVDADYPYFIAREWDPGYRAARIAGLLREASADGVSPAEMSAIQLDARVPRASLIGPRLAAAAPVTVDGQLVAERIRQWDGECTADSRGCAAYMVAEYRLLRALFDDDLGPLARDYVGTPMSWQALIAFLDRPNDPWWDDARTTTRETAAGQAAAALDAAGADLRRDLGGPEGWTWGRFHTTTWREGTLGNSGIGPLEWYFNRGPDPAAGAAGTVNNAYVRFVGAYDDPYTEDDLPTMDLRRLFSVTNLPSYRLVVDMADLDAARIVITTGQSGNPFDPRYGDLIDDWLAGRQVPLPFSREVVEAAGRATLTLTP